jgi:hypothetical protein
MCTRYRERCQVLFRATDFTVKGKIQIGVNTNGSRLSNVVHLLKSNFFALLPRMYIIDICLLKNVVYSLSV